MQNDRQELLKEQVVVINIGLRGFAKSMEEQGVEVVQVDWSPPRQRG